MSSRNKNDSGPFPKSVFPESVFPRRIFPWMGDDEDAQEPQTPINADRPKFPWEIEEKEQKDQNPVKEASPTFPWVREKEEPKTDSEEALFDFTRWKTGK